MNELGDTKGIRKRLLEQKPKHVVVKVGSAVLGGKDGLDGRVMMDLVQTIADLMAEGTRVSLVSSGAILAGRQRLGMTERPKTLPEKQACAALGQIELMARYRSLFEVRGVAVAQILLTAEDFVHRGRFLNARNTFMALHNHGILPIVNENDTVSTEEIKLGDNDNLSCLLLSLIGADLLVLLSDVNGLYERDPKQDPTARPLPFIQDTDPLFDKLPSAPVKMGTQSVGTGGITTKMECARKSLSMGIPMVWACGKESRALARILEGEELGTLFWPQGRGVIGSRRKAWLANAAKPRGRIVIDRGAAEALQSRGKSLLAKGIVAVEGAFQLGDLVQVMDPDNREIGRGLVCYSSDEVDRIKGMHSSDIGAVLGRQDYEEVMHRDNFVLYRARTGAVS